MPSRTRAPPEVVDRPYRLSRTHCESCGTEELCLYRVADAVLEGQCLTCGSAARAAVLEEPDGTFTVAADTPPERFPLPDEVGDDD